MPKIKHKYKQSRHSGGVGRGGVRVFSGKYRGSMYARRSRGKKVLSVILTIILGVAAIVAGYFLMRVILNKTHSPADTASDVGSVTESAESVTDDEVTTEPESEAPEETAEYLINGSFADANILYGGAPLDEWIAAAKQNGVNTLVVEIKNADGFVRYDSQVPEVQSLQAILEPIPDIGGSVARLHENEIKVIAKLYCFRDTVASAGVKAMSVQYMDQGFNWLDNAPAKGGRPWLNPYSSQAQSYLAAIAKEVSELGFDAVLLDGVQKPTGPSLSLATYGAESDGVPLADALTNFVSLVKQSVAEGTEVYVTAYGEGALYGSEPIYGGDPMRFGESVYCPDLRYGQFVDVTLAGRQVNGIDRTAEFVEVYTARLNEMKSDDVKTVPIIQGDGDALTVQKDALAAIGINEYIIMN